MTPPHLLHRRGHCGIDGTGAVLGKAGRDAGTAGERRGHIADIGDCDRHAAGGDKGVADFGGADDDVVNIVAARVGGHLKVRAADKAHHPAVAVDAEPGGIGTADAVADAAPCHIGTGHCGIDRSSGVFGISCAAGAGERGGHIAHIGHRHRHGLRDGVGVIGLGGGNDDVVNIAAGRAGWGLKVGAALPANHPRCCC